MKVSSVIRKRRGLTLLELMIVLVIVGVMASAAGVSFVRQMTASKQRNSLAQLKNIYVANQLYVAKTGSNCYQGVFDDTYINNDVNTLFGLNIPLDPAVVLTYDNWFGYNATFSFGTTGVTPGWWRIILQKNSTTEEETYVCQGDCFINIAAI